MEAISNKFTKENVKSLPESPGVYIYKNKFGKPVYIGKSINLKKRVLSYFAKYITGKTVSMLKETENFAIIVVSSELEALLLEAHLVRKFKPNYNFSLKDDKHPLYIRITKEKYPRVLTARKIDEEKSNLAFFGPFPSSKNIKSVLKMIRKIFPYSDHKLGKRGCLYSQIGLCQPCPNEIEKLKDEKHKQDFISDYKNNISNIRKLLSGKIKPLRNNLEKEMHNLSSQQNFENAAKILRQIEKLDYITQPITPVSYFLENPNLIEDIRAEELNELARILANYINVPKTLRRIECFDVAHLSGSYPTASMVTFDNGEPDKALYRHFRIRQKKGQSDADSMSEVAKRRTKYLSTWGVPDLIIVDGGKAQVSVFRKVFAKYKIPLIGLSKREEKLVIPIKRSDLSTHGFIEKKVPEGAAKNLVQRIRNEAHRFARRYHYNLLKRQLFPS